MRKCRCGRIIGEHNRFNRNKIHTDYCSRFCYESVERNNRISKSATLKCECYWCGAEMNLSYPYTLANARYCSSDCYSQIGKYKNGEYIRSKAPDWLNEILISEGWFPILDID